MTVERPLCHLLFVVHCAAAVHYKWHSCKNRRSKIIISACQCINAVCHSESHLNRKVWPNKDALFNTTSFCSHQRRVKTKGQLQVHAEALRGYCPSVFDVNKQLPL